MPTEITLRERAERAEKQLAETQAALEAWFPLGTKLLKMNGNKWAATPAKAIDSLEARLSKLVEALVEIQGESAMAQTASCYAIGLMATAALAAARAEAPEKGGSE